MRISSLPRNPRPTALSTSTGGLIVCSNKLDSPGRVCEAFPEQTRNSMMAANSAFMITEAERRFPVRGRIGVPPDALGSRFDQIKTRLDANCDAEGWAVIPSGTRGVLNDAVRFISRMPPSRVRSSLGGVPVTGSRPPGAYFGCGKMSRSR
jgi:hypothetical protein